MKLLSEMDVQNNTLNKKWCFFVTISLFQQLWTHLLKKDLQENFTFRAVADVFVK